MWSLRTLSDGKHSTPSRRQVSVLLGSILLLGLAVRLWLAPQEGYGFDIGVNQRWAKSAVLYGAAASYSQQVEDNMLPNYPPLGLLLFSGAGHVYHFLDADMPTDAMLFRIIIKMPSILADLLTAFLIFGILRRTRGARWGLIGAAVYAAHPTVIYNSAVWGQTDALYVVPVLLGLAALWSRRPGLGGALLALAALTKTQGIIFLPLILILSLRDLRGLLRACVGAAAATAVVLAPFAAGGALDEVLNVYTGSVGFYSTVTVGAYNAWWALLGDQAWSLKDTELLFGTVTYHMAGLIAFALAYALQAMILFRHRGASHSPRGLELLLLVAGLVGLGFFLFAPQMHERYMFPFLALALPWALRSSAAFAFYLLASAGALINLLGILPFSAIDRALFATFHTLDVLAACSMLFAFFGLSWMGWTQRNGAMKKF